VGSEMCIRDSRYALPTTALTRLLRRPGEQKDEAISYPGRRRKGFRVLGAYSTWRSLLHQGRMAPSPVVSPRHQNSTWDNLERMEGTEEAVSAEHVLTPSCITDPPGEESKSTPLPSSRRSRHPPVRQSPPH